MSSLIVRINGCDGIDVFHIIGAVTIVRVFGTSCISYT